MQKLKLLKDAKQASVQIRKEKNLQAGMSD